MRGLAAGGDEQQGHYRMEPSVQQHSVFVFSADPSAPGPGRPLSALVEHLDRCAAPLSAGLPGRLRLATLNIDFQACRHEAWACLSAAEQWRARGHVRPAGRLSYVLVHAMLRLLLARRLAIEPAHLPFTTGAGGKPVLAIAGEGGHFNISYRDHAFAIVTGNAPAGVDIESCSTDLDIGGVAGRLFAADELAMLGQAGSPEECRRIFFETWSRKEAVVKLFGCGIDDMPRFSTLQCCAGSNRWQPDRYCAVSLPAPRGHVLAIAVRA